MSLHHSFILIFNKLSYTEHIVRLKILSEQDMAPALKDVIYNCLLITLKQSPKTWQVDRVVEHLFRWFITGAKHCPQGEHQPPYWALLVLSTSLQPTGLPQCTAPGAPFTQANDMVGSRAVNSLYS